MHTARFSSSVGYGGLPNSPVGRPPKEPPCEQIDRCKNITLTQNSFASGNKL